MFEKFFALAYEMPIIGTNIYYWQWWRNGPVSFPSDVAIDKVRGTYYKILEIAPSKECLSPLFENKFIQIEVQKTTKKWELVWFDDPTWIVIH